MPNGFVGIAEAGAIRYYRFKHIERFRGIVQLVERRSPKPDVVGSSPTTPVSDFLAQWFSRLERRPVTAEVRGSSPLWVVWALSSAGRAPALQAGGHRFEPCSAHLKYSLSCGAGIF